MVRYIRVRQFLTEGGVFIYSGLAHLHILGPLAEYFAYYYPFWLYMLEVRVFRLAAGRVANGAKY